MKEQQPITPNSEQDPNGIIVNARIKIASWMMPQMIGDTDEDEAMRALAKADALILANNKYPFGTLESDDIF